MSITIPENIIYDSLDAILEIVKNDLENTSIPENKKILFEMLAVNERGERNVLNSMDYYNEAKRIFLKKPNLYFGYNQESSDMPAIHVIMASDSGKSPTPHVGEGTQEDIINMTDRTDSRVFTFLYGAQFNILITSENWSEVVLIYHTIKSLLLQLTEHFELSGLQNMTVSGQDITMQMDYMPVNIFHRIIALNFGYMTNVKSLQFEKLIKGVKLKQILTD